MVLGMREKLILVNFGLFAFERKAFEQKNRVGFNFIEFFAFLFFQRSLAEAEAEAPFGNLEKNRMLKTQKVVGGRIEQR